MVIGVISGHQTIEIMKTLTLKIKDIQILNDIQKRLSERKSLTEKQQTNLLDFLSQLPQTEALLFEQTSFDEQFEARLWDVGKIDDHLKKWQRLFSNIPGWDYCPYCFFVDADNVKMLHKNIILAAWFAPSMSYNQKNNEGYEVQLKDDGTANFMLPTLEDAEAYPELYNFKGTWKEAYYLLIETLKKGWPMEEFPEELLPLLKK
jgi:hypothetical protein